MQALQQAQKNNNTYKFNQNMTSQSTKTVREDLLFKNLNKYSLKIWVNEKVTNEILITKPMTNESLNNPAIIKVK